MLMLMLLIDDAAAAAKDTLIRCYIRYSPPANIRER